MITWNGISTYVVDQVTTAIEVQKQKKTLIYIVAGVIALGIFLLIRKH